MILDDYKPFEDDGRPLTTGQQQHTQPPTFSEANLAGQMQQQIPAYNQSAQANQVYGAAPQISTAELQVSAQRSTFVSFNIQNLEIYIFSLLF